MRPHLSVALTALVLLALLQAHRILLASVILGVSAGATPPVRPLAVLLALLPLALLALPALPLPLGRDRRALTALAACVAGLARLAAASPQGQVAGFAAALALAGAATYLGAGVGLLARRSVAAGAALAICLDELARWLLEPAALAHRSVRLGEPVLEAALIVLLALTALRGELDAGAGLERRAGGLRLRGALALGALLFLLTSALAAPVAARRAGLDRGLLAAALAGLAAGAALWLLAGGGPARLYRPRLVLMGALTGAAAMLEGVMRGPAAGLLLVGGALCALLLLGHALAPAHGRRGTWTAAGTLAVLATLDGALALATAAPPELAPQTIPWVDAVAALSLTGALVLIPRPAPAPPLLPRKAADLALVLALALALALAWLAGRRAETPRLSGGVALTPGRRP